MFAETENGCVHGQHRSDTTTMIHTRANSTRTLTAQSTLTTTARKYTHFHFSHATGDHHHHRASGVGQHGNKTNLNPHHQQRSSRIVHHLHACKNSLRLPEHRTPSPVPQITNTASSSPPTAAPTHTRVWLACTQVNPQFCIRTRERQVAPPYIQYAQCSRVCSCVCVGFCWCCCWFDRGESRYDQEAAAADNTTPPTKNRRSSTHTPIKTRTHSTRLCVWKSLFLVIWHQTRATPVTFQSSGETASFAPIVKRAPNTVRSTASCQQRPHRRISSAEPRRATHTPQSAQFG